MTGSVRHFVENERPQTTESGAWSARHRAYDRDSEFPIRGRTFKLASMTSFHAEMCRHVPDERTHSVFSAPMLQRLPVPDLCSLFAIA